MQLMHLKNIDQKKEDNESIHLSNDSLASNNISTSNRQEQDEKKIKSVYKNQLKNTEQVKTNLVKSPELKSNSIKSLKIDTYEDLIQIAAKDKEVELKYDLERNVKLVSFASGKINITFNEKLNKNFIKILTEKLLKWTGERWIISLSKEQGEKTVYEKNILDKSNKLEKEINSKLVKDFISVFPDAKLIDVSEDDDA